MKKKNNIYQRNITSIPDQAIDLFDAGADVIAVDFTYRGMDHSDYIELSKTLRSRRPGIVLLADISTINEAIGAELCGVEYVSTTMYGYTSDTCSSILPDLDFLRSVTRSIKIPCIAEGGYSTPNHIRESIKGGAYGVVVGTAITRPHIITAMLAKEFMEVQL